MNISQYIKIQKKFPAIIDPETYYCQSLQVIPVDKLEYLDLLKGAVKDGLDNPLTDMQASLTELPFDTASFEDMQKYVDSFDDRFDKDLKGGRSGETRKAGFQSQSGTADGQHFDSKWEYAYYLYSKDILGNSIERNQGDYLFYIDASGKRRRFFYDFMENGNMVEVKGIFRDNDILKMEQCPQVKFIYGDAMKKVLGTLKKEIPNWLEGFIPD